MKLQGGNDRSEASRSESTTENTDSAPIAHSKTVRTESGNRPDSTIVEPQWVCESCGKTYESYTRSCQQCGSHEFRREAHAEDQQTSYYTGVVSYVAAITAPINPYVPR